MSNTFYITTPIYYPNGEPHLGSVYTTVICDVLARYHRLRGRRDVLPHRHRRARHQDGQGRRRAGRRAAASWPTKYATIFRDVWKELNITNDDFIRTTEERHKSAVQEIVQKLVANGDIYLGGYEGWYDEGQEEFVTETEAKTNEFKSQISGKPLTRYSEPTYFFRLSKYVAAVHRSTSKRIREFILPESRGAMR